MSPFNWPKVMRDDSVRADDSLEVDCVGALVPLYIVRCSVPPVGLLQRRTALSTKAYTIPSCSPFLCTGVL